ncbi:Mitochondrial ribosomal protein S33 [Fasciolopsis buskii]|uniref:Small ribosomal subunit protein mS33 n=1 Tax=Fasciolopsis buskii TaxID=27845 RepID=A0A8E0VMV2_9TREM|nr:Mitochondrial ribosomal protein S33 [Fasciolopsis buski]
MTSEYVKRLTVLAGRIFVDVGRVIDKKSEKVVRIMSEKPKPMILKDYYPPLEEYRNILVKLRSLGLYRDEHADFRDEMRRLRELRGKGKRKKGEGRRATLR